MTSYRVRLLALVCLSFSFSHLPRESRACSICQCGDALYSPEGAGAQPTGAFSFYLENRHTWKSSGTLPEDPDWNPGDRERSYDRDLTLWASWTPVSRLTLSASVPYRFITIDEEPAADPSSRMRNRGFGDAALYGTSVLWRDLERSPTAWIGARAMLKTPTGASEKSIGGEREPHLQVGSGSWDWGLGLAAGKRIEQGNLYASAFYRVNQQGSLDYRYGSAVLANLIYSTPALAIAPLGGLLVRPGAELNFRYAGKDASDGSSYDSSGGSILYLTPFVEIPITRNAEERAAGRAPLMGSGAVLSGDAGGGDVAEARVGSGLAHLDAKRGAARFASQDARLRADRRELAERQVVDFEVGRGDRRAQ